jgi:hypothetical protein
MIKGRIIKLNDRIHVLNICHFGLKDKRTQCLT